MKIRPGDPGMCYRNAYKWASEHEGNDPLIVHGVVTNAEGRTFAHAWIELGKNVVDPTAGVIIDKKKFYKLLSASPHAAYTVEQAAINMVRARKHGPWFKDEVGKRYVWRGDD